MPGYDDDLRLAHVLADAVERITTARFRAEDLRVETKPDLTLVSDADRDAEELIRGQLKRTRPRDAVIGEEFAPTGSSNRASGWSTRSTAPTTSSAGCPCGPPSSPWSTTASR